MIRSHMIVWASSDSCVTWTLLSATAAFPPRRDFSLLSTSLGILILLGGQDAINAYNDLYASFNGGYTWILLPESSRTDELYKGRYSLMAVIAADGYLYMGGGMTAANNGAPSGSYIRDIRRSSIPFQNVSMLANVFQTDVPNCGVGLYCLDDSTAITSNNNVYCNACANNPIPVVVFAIVVGVLVFLFILFILYRNFFAKSRVLGPINEHLVNTDELDE